MPNYRVRIMPDKFGIGEEGVTIRRTDEDIQEAWRYLIGLDGNYQETVQPTLGDAKRAAVAALKQRAEALHDELNVIRYARRDVLSLRLQDT